MSIFLPHIHPHFHTIFLFDNDTLTGRVSATEPSHVSSDPGGPALQGGLAAPSHRQPESDYGRRGSGNAEARLW
jgi:hypothetical protein